MRTQQAMPKKRATCPCPAYPWPHRPGGGHCRYPLPPSQEWVGKCGKHIGTGARRRSALRRRLLERYRLHPIRDREKIRRFLPKLYVAHGRRHGWPWPYWWLGGYVPAMLVTEHGAPAGVVPDNSQSFWAVVLHGTPRKWGV